MWCHLSNGEKLLLVFCLSTIDMTLDDIRLKFQQIIFHIDLKVYQKLSEWKRFDGLMVSRQQQSHLCNQMHGIQSINQ